ncbi:MAG: tRNA preQ1(34) S-adenosylmethionine ribosyltransferase-isomerase QueA [Acidimicrobiia bacterium]|nr:tRNA preQ1(34) S-adenosylmethionine ribosyltransferase-isomerase QueA [Acidimicrobiia bacterium]
MRVSEFEYQLPDEAIAQSPVEPRHASRLLDTRDLTDHRFVDLPRLLEPGDLVVVNETKVRAARLIGHRSDTGGRVELLLLDRRPDGLWDALAKPARRLRPGVRVEFRGLAAIVRSAATEGVVTVDLAAEELESAIEAAGSVPLPPYFTGSLIDDSRYQTVFANEIGSAAAPTAGLHFTTEVMMALEKRGIEMATVDLHVSLDTFRPIAVEDIEDHRMHTEWCRLPAQTAEAVAEARRRGQKVVAVGTTVVRTLETFGNDTGRVSAGEKRTDLFIRPGYEFRVVDAMVTNFHIPGSTLLVMLAAFMGERWRSAYEVALKRGYRFLSFGDAMYAERLRP